MTTRRAALAWVACASLASVAALAQTAPPAPRPAPPVASAAASAASHPASATRGVKSAAPPRVANGPLWRELSSGQQQALSPLAGQWDTLSEAQKRKWIALSANFPKLSGEEQAKLHSRMSEWVSLSAQQRTMARLSYGETRKLSPDDKKAKWEAYQALPPEEKKKLAATAPNKTPTTAAAVRPVPREKLATLPKSRPEPDAKPPRIAAAPHQVDHNTLLPQQVPVSESLSAHP